MIRLILLILKTGGYIGAALLCALIISGISGGSATAEIAQQSLSYMGKVPPSKPTARGWGKDPFVPLVVQQAEVKDKKQGTGQVLRLTAVFFSDVRPSAIVNDKIVYVGGIVDGQKIVDIGRTHVILHGVSGRVRLDIAGGPESQ